MITNTKIPVFSLEGSGKDFFEIHHVNDDLDYSRMRLPHRDTNFILAFLKTGSCEMVVDFEKLRIQGPSIFCILPGQIHQGLSLSGIQAWILGVDGALIDPLMRQVLIEESIRSRLVMLQEREADLLERSFQLLKEIDIDPGSQFSVLVQRKMLDTCTSLFTSIYHGMSAIAGGLELRPSVIHRAFWALLLRNFRTMKRPKDYASALNISLTYLNEVIKDLTGFPVSYWIIQEITIEAKRLLYYTDSTVKEIGLNLGYADIAYFIRLFRKIVGQTPLKFRQLSRQQHTPLK
jgi:AraC family transcriptional activator of pobA